MSRSSVVAFLMAVTLSAGCNSSPEVAPAPPPLLEAESTPAVVLPSGDRIVVEIAANDVTRARGLMFRDRLEPGRGMLFVFPDTAAHAFWMKNTLIALDMIWIDEAGTVVDVRAAVPPCPADPCPSYPPAAPGRYVLELGSGEAASKNIRPGVSVRFENLERYGER